MHHIGAEMQPLNGTRLQNFAKKPHCVQTSLW
jgi:hypothetical protein